MARTDATLVDTNVLIDVIVDDPDWAPWSACQLDVAAARGDLMINDVIYAELSVRFDAIEALDDALDQFGLTVAPIPKASLFLAGKAHLRYRKFGGTRTGVLADFFIGAHASLAGWTILTRDIRRYHAYYPALTLVFPPDED